MSERRAERFSTGRQSVPRSVHNHYTKRAIREIYNSIKTSQELRMLSRLKRKETSNVIMDGYIYQQTPLN